MITNADIKIRRIEPCDIGNLFKWRNHPDVRKNSFNSNLLQWTEHEKWFKAKSNDPDTTIYIAYCDKENSIGSIRFENKSDVVKVSVMLNPSFIGKGLGVKVIRAGVEKFISEKKTNKPIIAEIKKDNIVSIKTFQKANFVESYVTFVYRP